MRRKGHLGFAALTFATLTYFQNNINSFLISYDLNQINIHDINEALIISVIAYFMGERTPDLDLKFKHFTDKPYYTYHRQITHSLFIWIGLFIYSLYLNHSYSFILTFYSLGGLTHLFADILTGTVPYGLYGSYKKSFSRFGLSKLFGKSFSKFVRERLPIHFEKIGNLMFFIGCVLTAYFINVY